MRGSPALFGGLHISYWREADREEDADVGAGLAGLEASTTGGEGVVLGELSCG
jgi:hypothetical protein